jgi:hypothetical protein
MLAGRALPYTFLGTVVVAAALVPGTVRAGDDDAIVADEVAADQTRAIVASHFDDLTPAERRERARQTGHVRITGAAHLSGRIIAESFTIERGAVATIEPGTVIWSAGDIRIDGPIVAPPPDSPPVLRGPRKAGAGGLVGGNGSDAQAVIFSGTTYSVTVPTQLADGGDGQSVAGVAASGVGGNGGLGGGIIIQCTDTATISANLIPGRGGRGGDARITGADGAPSANGGSVDAACGGKGGKSGDVRITAPTVVFTLDQVMIGRAAGRIGLRPGGRGGDGIATGGKGGDAIACYTKGGNGGKATAIGGSAGASTNALVECKVLEQADFDAHDIASFDPSESPDGGTATATGGSGGRAFECASSGCPAVGLAGGAGGRGGNAKATGGKGGSGGRIGGGHGVLRIRQQAQAEASPGVGGNAVAQGGDGNDASSGQDGQSPGAGGAGGSGGSAITIGGKGGSSRLGKKFGQPLAGGQGPLKGGRGGDATSTSGSGGDGANGGNCCDKSGGGGAPGGAGGVAGPSGAVRGKGGLGFTPGDDGVATANVGAKGAKGIKGEGCPGIVNEWITVTGTLPGPLFVGQDSPLTLDFVNTCPTPSHLKVEICCDGKIFFTFFVDVPAGTMAMPGLLHSLSNLHIDSPHAAHHISVMVNGKLVLLFVVAVI